MILLALLAATAIDPVAEKFLRYDLFDYDSAKIEVIREPYADTFTPAKGWFEKTKPEPFAISVQCYRINSKNRMGGYTGWNNYLLIFRDNDLWFQAHSPTQGYQNPEITKRCVTPSAK